MLARLLAACGLAFAILSPACAQEGEYISGIEWQEPPIVTPGKTNADPPSDATILFDGTNLDAWHNGDKWEVKDGVAIVHDTDITSKQSFGDCQLHVEWSPPDVVNGGGQHRGNSGVFLMDRYEMQVLDSYKNKTYPDGQAAGMYKQTPPMVNAMRKPEEWNTYDIFWTAPKFKEDGSLESPAYITALHNGVLVLNHYELKGNTPFNFAPTYEAHGKLPIRLQDHGNPMQYRNIWVREIKPPVGKQAREPYYRDNSTGKEWPAKKKTAAVSGNISIGGRPLRNGKIVLHASASGSSVEAEISGGRFELSNIAPGQYQVFLKSTNRNRESEIPTRYTLQDESGLRFDVRDGNNELDINLNAR